MKHVINKLKTGPNDQKLRKEGLDKGGSLKLLL